MTVYLGIDYGTKRIGLAVSAGVNIASPLTMVQAVGNYDCQVGAVLEAAEEFDVDEFVLGLPLNMDGTEGDQAKVTRRFGDALARLSNKPVHYVDERLTTQAAEDVMRGGGLTNKKRKVRIDALAARALLQSYLDKQIGAVIDQNEEDDDFSLHEN